jgi:hypothetical protein
MECVILYRTRGSLRLVEYVSDPDGTMTVFPHFDAAAAYALSNALFDSGQADYQIVELDEL